MVLGLDIDTTHDNGNEIVLLRDLLSADGNTGAFSFNFVDENGDAVPAGTYRVFATVDDDAHDVVIVDTTGQLIVNF